MDISSYLILLFFPFLMAYAAFSDLFSMTISNKISLLLIIGFVFFAWQIEMELVEILRHISIFAIVLVIGFVVFALNLAGGGDIKLLACTALWFGYDTASYLVLSSFYGAFLAIIILNWRGMILSPKLHSISWVKQLHEDGFGMPYGVALGAGAITVFPSTLWMQHVISKAIS